MSKEEHLKKYIKSLDGYKISETHFKIGSKIHSSDFYYAKRLFQNSYYTARIALLLAIKIKDELTDIRTPLTIVGYEMYSELLISLIKKFLTEYGYENINHFLTIDTGETIEHLPDDVSLFDQVVIVVPITSTGSTSLKIEDYVKSLSQSDPAIFHFNVLQACDESKKDFINSNQNTIIKLNTDWELPSSCKWCFDEDQSRPLFETDKSSLTPALIFDLPSAKNTTVDETSVDFDDIKFGEALIYRQVKRNNEHFLFSTKTDKLIEINNDKIESWLKKIKEKIEIGPAERIVIISPCHYTNTGFINLVNDILFQSSATIIHHQADVDYLSNFRLLNKTFLTLENSKVFFVDDALISGATFFKLYDLYRYTTNYDPVKRLSGAIFLSNKSSPDIHKRVSRAANSIYSFVNINLPKPPKVFGQKPLEHEVKRYEAVSNMALHDVPQKYFSDKSKNTDGKPLSNLNKKSDNSDVEKTKRHLKMFKATHKAYEYFRKINDTGHQNDFDIDNLLEECGFNNSLQDKTYMMKVLSQYPFLLYKPVRKNVFIWHKQLFNEKILSLKVKIHKESKDSKFITYEEFRELKFLIRRSVFLGNFQIISSDFFNLIKRIFDIIDIEDGIYHTPIKIKKSPDLFEEESEQYVPLDKHERKNLNDFQNYLLYQYLELIHKNAWCAAKINENIKDIENEFLSPQGQQFIRMLKIETTIVLNDFYALLNEKNKWRDLYKYKFENGKKIKNNEIDQDIKKIINYLYRNDNVDIFNTNKFKISNQVLGLISETDEKLKDVFLIYLWVKQFLNTDQEYKAGNISLTNKTESVFTKLKGLFNDGNNVGAFFIVTDGKDIPHLVYDEDSNGNHFLNELDNDKHQAIMEFLDGQPDAQEIAQKSIVEFEKNDDDKWVDTYSLESEPNPVKFVADAHWLMLVRISDQESEIKTQKNISGFKTLGLMGFYAKKNPNEILPKKLLMLLRKDIGAFINKHHKTDEFSALREAESIRRFAYLAGHGRQMMQKLCEEPDTRDTFQGIVGTLEKLQYLIATKMIRRDTFQESYKKELSEYFLNREINTDTVNKIVTMGNKIYKTNIIENEVSLKNKLQENCVENDFAFSFDSDILKFICFELIVNAKKNRFHDIDGDNKFCECDNNENELDLEFEIKNGKMKLRVTGTGPKFRDEDKTKVNSGNLDSIKKDSEIAGLDLIHQVIKLLNKGNTIMIEEPELVCNNCGIYKNTVVVELTSMDYV